MWKARIRGTSGKLSSHDTRIKWYTSARRCRVAIKITRIKSFGWKLLGEFWYCVENNTHGCLIFFCFSPTVLDFGPWAFGCPTKLGTCHSALSLGRKRGGNPSFLGSSCLDPVLCTPSGSNEDDCCTGARYWGTVALTVGDIGNTSLVGILKGLIWKRNRWSDDHL